MPRHRRLAGPPRFAIERRPADDGAVRLVLHGELDVATQERLRSAILAEEPSGRPIVVILDDLEYLDSAGIGVLLEALRRAQREGRSFRVTPGLGNARHVLDVVGLLDELCGAG
jgi:anti-sigma B factor antagonist